MVKPPSLQASMGNKVSDHDAIAKAADELSDKPYGFAQTKTIPITEEQDPLERITITLPRSLRYRLDDLALQRKRNNHPEKNASAILRVALERYFDENS
jgi:hypothetical protein